MQKFKVFVHKKPFLFAEKLFPLSNIRFWKNKIWNLQSSLFVLIFSRIIKHSEDFLSSPLFISVFHIHNVIFFSSNSFTIFPLSNFQWLAKHQIKNVQWNVLWLFLIAFDHAWSKKEIKMRDLLVGIIFPHWNVNGLK